MSTRQVHIARNGQMTGPVDIEKISASLEEGSLLPTDHYYDEATTSWIPLSQWKNPPLRESRRFTPAEPDSSKVTKRNRGKKSVAQKREHFALGGWIACLFAVGGAAGIWAWAQSLSDELAVLNATTVSLKASIAVLKQENLALNEMTPPGRVRCIVTYEPSSDQVAILSGVTVGLYRRADVERVLQQPGLITNDFDDSLQKVKSTLPSPIAVTLSDSNGRIDMAIPEPGDYVIAASAANDGGRGQLLWLAGFTAAGDPSKVLLLTERGAISPNRPKFAIKDTRNLASPDSD